MSSDPMTGGASDGATTPGATTRARGAFTGDPALTASPSTRNPTPAAVLAEPVVLTCGSSFEGRTVVVTGAGSGVGRTAALAFALQGAKVLVADADPVGAHATVRGIAAVDAYAAAVVGDLADTAVVDDVVATTLCAFGGLDVLVHGAEPTVPLTRAVLPHMLTAGGGSIVFAGGGPGVAHLVASLQVAYRERGIRAHAVGLPAAAGPQTRAAAILRLAATTVAVAAADRTVP
ncbi:MULTISPECIES: SDR family NAD(P)-dependent oxidoreductase [Streptomyces]|uniref:SDR family NAD(P)-dependent oxidoreductase n=2 Tax=Streptomyces TaxID=1883 RepID=A0ABV9IVW0_9ACTN